MAKKKLEAAEIIIKLSDGKSIKLFGDQVKKATKDVDNLSKSEATLNRNFKGASQQSSNTTKNFSKMAQGITGGLVPAYATLAANIFAITAAFRFLQDAANYRILIEGQREYARITGESLALITRRLQEATGQQLAFSEAAQSVAIARAAGLTTDQISRLGAVARNASIALGRDLTDSLNRLIRGTTKAEPELLDELGIILRLEQAAANYGLKIGKAAKNLSIFEKSQAVVNEVLEQGETKFGEFNTELNAFTKLAKSFDDLLNRLKKSLTGVAEFMAKAFSQNTLALAGAGTLLTTGITQAITPDAPQFSTFEAGEAARERLGSFYKGKRDISTIDSKGLDAMERDIKRAYRNKRSTVINFEKVSRAEALRTIEIIRINTLRAEAEKANIFKRTILNMRAEYATLRGTHGKTMAFMTTTARAAGRAMTTALKFAGYIGIILTLVGVLKQLYDTYLGGDKATNDFKGRQKAITKTLEEQNKVILDLQKNAKETTTALEKFAQKAKIFSNFSFMGAGTNFGEAEKGPLQFSERKGENKFRFTAAQSKIINETTEALKLQIAEVKPHTDAYDDLNRRITFFTAAMHESDSAGGLLSGTFENVAAALLDIEENGTKAMQELTAFQTLQQKLNNESKEFQKSQRRLAPDSSQRTVGSQSMAIYGSGLQDTAAAINKGTFTGLDEFAEGVPETILNQLRSMLGSKAVEEILKENVGDAVGQIKALGDAAVLEAERLEKVEIRLLTRKKELSTELLSQQSRAGKLLGSQLAKENKVLQIQEDIFAIENARAERALDPSAPQLTAAQAAEEETNFQNLKTKLEIAEREADLLQQVESTFRDSFEQGMATAFKNIIDGTKTMKEAFQSMTQAILNSLAQILAQQAALTIMRAAGFGAGARYGGIMSPTGKSFAQGGYAVGPDSGYPATLHGTEAVVPLGNDRHIPVKFEGKAGSAGNVTVNVNMASGETQATGDDSLALGKAIATAVQQEISKQQRPGGTLSPY
tara:strand:- start:1129 stop:4116 length:2988 start_codon:yes stop_codon:yes gene_type:complete